MTPEITYAFSPESGQIQHLVDYLLEIIQRQFNIVFVVQPDFNRATIQFSTVKSKGNYFCDLDIYRAFLEDNYQGALSHLNNDPLAEAFYRLNCLQEYHLTPEKKDAYGRIRYEYSTQSMDDNIYKDIVSNLFLEFLHRYIPKPQLNVRVKSAILLSHDIDRLYGGLRDQVKNIFKKSFITNVGVIFRHILGIRKCWDSFNEIQSLEEKFGARSIYYFLPFKGEISNIDQADYRISDVQLQINKIIQTGCEIGLHKSSNDSASYKSELELITHTLPTSNRNHYLRYRLPQDWIAMEKAGIELDSGLGFSSMPGLRNNYPLPFQPFAGGRKLKLIVIPLVIMDTTFDKYFSAEDIITFFEEMRNQWNYGYCVSVLFHNNYLTPHFHKNFHTAYRDLLELCVKNKITFLTTANIKKIFF